MSSDNMTPSTFTAMQEDSDFGVSEIGTEVEETHGRFSVTGSGPAHMYPSGKEGQTTKDRRYLPKVKFSDRGKALGKTPGQKGKSYRQLKHEGTSAGSV